MDSSSSGTLDELLEDDMWTPDFPDEMDSSSRVILWKILTDIIRWRLRFPDEFNYFRWSEFHLRVARSYVIKLDLNSHWRVLRAANLFKEPLWYHDHQSLRKYPPLVAYFTQELQEFFTVPSSDQISDRKNTLKKSELVAAFINFLLQLLYHKTDLIDRCKDRIESLQKHLRFLFSVLGDAFLLRDDLEQVQHLLTESEAVATEAGILVHSFFFSTDPVFQIMSEDLDLLFVHIRHLNDGIVELSNLPPFVADINMTSKVAEIDSLFSVDSFLCDLEDLLNQDNGLTENVKSRIKILHQELMPPLSFLKRMKLSRHEEIEGLKEAQVRIKDMAYESEYVINSFLVGDVPLPYFSNRLSHVIHKIKLVEDGLQEIKRNYNSRSLEVGKPLTTPPQVQAKKNPEVEGIIVGFEESTIRILDQLVGGTDQLQIISVFGMPGLGKTTLAKKLYNHRSVNDSFDKCMWCVVSQTYQKRNLLIDILISSASEFDKARILNMEEELLGQLIHQSLKGRRYLIVMDDIWDSDAWNELWRFFPDDRNGSRILFTSRNKEVAPPNSMIYPLPSLTNDRCWELLERKVFQNEPCPPELQGIGKEIAANCGGLPLTVVVVAGILSTLDKEESAWRKVGGDLASYLFLGGDNMMQLLGLSYKHLPEHLKPCFLYFGAFPEDTEIPTWKLMRLWIAEGFVHKELRKSSEIIAEEYLMELINKSLVIVAKRRKNGGIKTCLIHDLLRDFCLKICQGENFLKFVDNNYSLYEEGQRLVSLQGSVTPFGQHVRSFQGHRLDFPFYVLNMRLLRVLDFEEIYSHASLIGIEYLINLRYLVIIELSALIGRLVNLEYLRVEKKGIVRVPSVILKMVKLRHLQINHGKATFEEECSSSHTNKLEVFSYVIIKEQKDEDILKCSPNLRKLKCRYEPLEEVRGEDRNLDLQLFTQLESLNIESIIHRIGEINFPLNVKKLNLWGLCLPWEKMQIIGRLPFLEVLKLGYDAFVGKTWETRDDEFQQLRFLKLQFAFDLAEWHVRSWEHFPRLERLEMYCCRSLQEIPTEIGDIATLQVIKVRWCPKEVEESAIEIQRVQREMGNDGLNVIISHAL